MITIEQATEYLKTQGITVPAFILEAFVEQVNSIQPCLEEHYTPGTALLIQSYLLSLIGMAQGYKYIASERAPSGASRSYVYMSLKDHWNGIYNLLRSLDKYGCATDLIPADPTMTLHAGLWVATGGCHE